MPDGPIWVHADADRLEQVLVNLLNNAAKYTPSHGRIELRVDWDEADVQILVKDTGIGIEPQLLPRVFELFTQAERSLDRSRGGLGVGLSLVRSLVELHGGIIQASSDVGAGSQFLVRLPGCRECPAPADQAARAFSSAATADASSTIE
jgi:signal transduction histidine kinase